MQNRHTVLIATIVALGISLAGWFIGRGFINARFSGRYVTVRGISERDAKADLALWPIRLVATGNDLRATQDILVTNISKVRDFLARHGIESGSTDLQKLDVIDAFANPYQDARVVRNRYVVRQTLMVRSDRPDTVLKASQQVGELVSGGIVLSTENEYTASGPTFLFTKLNELKPEMISEAITNGRKGATRFAESSESSLGGIRQANQGLFEILPRDNAPGITEGSQIHKRIRVVSTIDYFLSD
jgi:hypothetical protein